MSFLAGLVVASKLLIVLALVPAVSSKIGRGKRVAESLHRWKLVGRGLTLPLARIVIATELLLLLALSANVATKAAALLGVALFVGMAVAAASVVYRGIATTCTCFSLEGTERVTSATVVRAAGLALLAGVVAAGSDWAIRPGLDWSSILLVLTIPLWIVLARRVAGGLQTSRASCLVAFIGITSAMALAGVTTAKAQESRTVIAVDAEIREIGEKYFGGLVQVYADHELCGEWSFTDPAQRTPGGGSEFELARDDQPAACGRPGATISFFDGYYVGLSNSYPLELGTRIVVDWFLVGPREGLDEGPAADGRTFLTIDPLLRSDAVPQLDVYAEGDLCGRFSFTDAAQLTPGGGAEFELARDDQARACGREGAIITLVGPNGVRLSAVYRLVLGSRIAIHNFTFPPPHTGGSDAPDPGAPAAGSGLVPGADDSAGRAAVGAVSVVLLAGAALYVITKRRRGAPLDHPRR
jgi:hypothetical protein